MPTIQEEMSKILNEWDKPEPQPTETNIMKPNLKNNTFGVTNNVTRATFDYIKRNPGVTASQVAVALANQGYKPSSVTSIMAQMYRQNQMRKEGYKYFATVDEYVPLKGSYKAKKLAERAKAKTQSGIATLPTPKPATIKPEPAKLTAKDVLDSLTVKEARELWLELSQYFGG